MQQRYKAMGTKSLNVSRAKDRSTMLEAIAGCLCAGWTIVIDELMTRDRKVWIHLHGPRGLSLTIVLDGDSNLQREGCFVLSWHFRGPDYGAGTKLNPTVWASVNQCHFHKATDIAYGFDSLLSVVRRRMSQANDGTAFTESNL